MVESGFGRRGVAPVSTQTALRRHHLVLVLVDPVGRSSKRLVCPRSGNDHGRRHPVSLQDGHGAVDPGEPQVPMVVEKSIWDGSSFQRRGGPLHAGETSQGGHRETLGEGHGVDSHGHVAKWTTLGKEFPGNSDRCHGFDSGPEQGERNPVRDRQRRPEVELFLQLVLHQRG